MRKHRPGFQTFLIWIVALLSVPFNATARTEPEEAQHPLTVDDVLKLGGVGVAKFSRDGKWLTYNLLPPYDTISDYSYWMRAAGLSGHQLWIMNLSTGSKPILQPGLDLDATNFLFDTSPDSERVVVLEHKRGRIRIAACRIGKNDCVRFDPMPDIRDMYFAPSSWNERLIWNADSRFILPTRSPQRPGSELRSRGASAEFLWGKWHDAWSGRRVTATTVSSSSRPHGDAWAEGALVEFDVDIGTAETIASGRFAGARLSPDKTQLVAAKVGERVQPPASAVTLAETHPSFDRRYAVALIDLPSKNVRRFDSPYNVDPNTFVWATDSERFAVFGWEKSEAPSEGAYYIVDVGNLVSRRLDHTGIDLADNRLQLNASRFVGPARAILLDDGLAVFGRLQTSVELAWHLLSPNRPIKDLTSDLTDVSGQALLADEDSFGVLSSTGVHRVVPARRTEMLYPLEGAEIRQLSYRVSTDHSWANEFRFDASRIAHDLDSHATLVQRAQEPYAQQTIHFLHLGRGGLQASSLVIPMGDVEILATSSVVRSAIFTEKDGAATRVMMKRADTDEAVELARVNEHMNKVARPGRKQIRYDVPDLDNPGRLVSVESCLLLPPDFSPDRKYPLLVEMYPGGGPSSCTTIEENASPGALKADLWPARGYIYFRPAVPQQLASTRDGPISGVDEILDHSIDAVLELGYVDASEITLLGFSQGAVMALYAASQMDRFSAVIAMNGWSDFVSHYFGPRGLMRYFHLDQNGGDNRWRYECSAESVRDYCPFGFGTSPFESFEAYIASSPVVWAHKISAPVLLIHSDLDYFDMSQFDEMFGALYRSGKDATYLRYWGEGHGLSSPANIRDLWSNVDSFLSESSEGKD